MDKITIAILSAGIPKKMKSHGPTALFKVGNDRYLVDDQILKLKEIYPNADIKLILGYEHAKILKKIKYSNDVEIIINKDYEHTNSAYSLGLAMEKSSTNNMLFIHGDLYFNKNIHNDNVESYVLYDKNNCIKSNKPGIIFDKYLENINFIHRSKWCQIAYISNHEYLACEKIFKGSKYTFEIINDINSKDDCKFSCISPENMLVVELESSKDFKSEKFKNIDSQ